ncbi:MAG: phosphatidylglycerol lysyltransferase domain-containing protein [Phycisphaerae bacterium]
MLGDAVQRFSFQQRLDYLRQFGTHCMAYSTLQPGMRYHDIPGVGYMAYRQYCGTRFVLGDPICAFADIPRIVGEALREHRQTCFVQIREHTAMMLRDEFGLRPLLMGVETLLPLAHWNLTGKRKQVVRTARNQAVERGITVEEDGSSPREELERISEEWLGTRRVKSRQMSFLVRPFDMQLNGDTRMFVARRDGRLTGFAVFDPIYSQGRVIGYTPDITRSSQDFRQGVYYCLITTAAERFKDEGAEILNLGLSPLAVNNGTPRSESWLVTLGLDLLFERGNRFYNFKGVCFTKSRFCGSEIPVFFSHSNRYPFRQILSVMSLSNVL